MAYFLSRLAEINGKSDPKTNLIIMHIIFNNNNYSFMIILA